MLYRSVKIPIIQRNHGIGGELGAPPEPQIVFMVG